MKLLLAPKIVKNYVIILPIVKGINIQMEHEQSAPNPPPEDTDNMIIHSTAQPNVTPSVTPPETGRTTRAGGVKARAMSSHGRAKQRTRQVRERAQLLEKSRVAAANEQSSRTGRGQQHTQIGQSPKLWSYRTTACYN